MLPVLLDLKLIKVYTFGVFLVLAFFWSTFMLWKNVRLTQYKEEQIFDGIFLSILISIFTGRLLYVLLNLGKFGFDPVKFILINGYPGISFYGSLIGGIVFLLLYFNSRKIKFLETSDYFITPLFIALGIEKLGAFFAGTEIGTKTTFFLAIKYANFAGFRHITALYESVLFFLAAFLSYKMLFQIRRGVYKKGTCLYFSIWYIAAIYLLFDPLKSVHTNIFGISFDLIVSSALLLTVSIYLLYHYRVQILERTNHFINFTFLHVNHTFKAIRIPTGKKAKGGKGKDSEPNS